MEIIEPDLVFQNHVIQEVHSAVALYCAYPKLFFLFFIIWSSYIDLMELSVLYFPQVALLN